MQVMYQSSHPSDYSILVCLLNFSRFPSSCWSCQCPCGCGTALKRHIMQINSFGTDCLVNISKKTFLDQGIQEHFHLMLKTEALLYTVWAIRLLSLEAKTSHEVTQARCEIKTRCYQCLQQLFCSSRSIRYVTPSITYFHYENIYL